MGKVVSTDAGDELNGGCDKRIFDGAITLNPGCGLAWRFCSCLWALCKLERDVLAGEEMKESLLPF
jgi:hypothetical protein